jgi:hypothetical protein
MIKKFVFRQGDTITLLTFGKTSNAKIAEPHERIVQSFHFSREQFEVAIGKTNMREFFSHDAKVCFDCPFAVSNGAKLQACYTHKVMQYTGFLSSLRSIGKAYADFNLIPQLSFDMCDDIAAACEGLYVRFGSYGEPTLLPIQLVSRICAVAKSWTGYTHQWATRPEFAPYYMASVHTAGQELLARQLGWRSFVASANLIEGLVNCPASEEQGYRSNCSKCGLCSGTEGKGKKSVVILEH